MRIASNSLSSAASRAFKPRDQTAAAPANVPLQAPAKDTYTPGVAGPKDLFSRLAAAARGAQQSSPTAPTQNLTKALEGMFGIKIAAIDLGKFDTSHDLQVDGQTDVQAGPEQVDYDASYRQVEETRLAAEGTLTTAEGRSFHFTLDYFRHQEVSIQASGSQSAPPPRPEVTDGTGPLAPPPPPSDDASSGPSLMASLKFHRHLHRELSLLPKTQNERQTGVPAAYGQPTDAAPTVDTVA